MNQQAASSLRVIPTKKKLKKFTPPQKLKVKSKFGPQKKTFWPKTGPFGAPGGSEEGLYKAKLCGNHVTNPAGPIGSSWDQIWPPRPSEDLRGPKKGLLGPKRALLGAPGVP